MKFHCTLPLIALLLAAPTLAQKAPQNDDPIKITHPTTDIPNARVTLAAGANFWNERLADWVEVALSGRPSDFLHETILSATTTRSLLESALKDVGFRDADTWASSVRDFPKIRGDRLLILISFTRDNQPQTFSLDELLSFENWNTSIGPYGFMFKGDPEHTPPASRPADAPPNTDPDRLKILRDDPQIALVFKGIQSMSQSFADHPLAYDDWLFPMMNLGRNTAVLPANIFNANASLPVTITFQKVTEESLLTESAKVWHDPAAAKFFLEQLPIAKKIDTQKAQLLALLPDVKKIASNKSDPATRDIPHEQQLTGQATLLTAQIYAGYTQLDAAWGKWSADHAKFPTDTPADLAQFKEEAARWSTHLALLAKSAAATADAQSAQFEQQQLAHQPQTNDTAARLQQLRAAELTARSAALLADTAQESDYWKRQQARIDPATDARKEWINEIALHIQLNAAREAAGATGQSLGNALRDDSPAANTLQTQYAAHMLTVQTLQLRLQLSAISFEITKREGLDDDPELPDLRKQKADLEAKIAHLQLPPREAAPSLKAP